MAIAEIEAGISGAGDCHIHTKAHVVKRGQIYSMKLTEFFLFFFKCFSLREEVRIGHASFYNIVWLSVSNLK